MLPEVLLGVREAMLSNLNEKFNENLVLLRCKPWHMVTSFLSWLPPCNALVECLPIDPKLRCTSTERNWVSSLKVLSVEPHSKVNRRLGIFLSYCGLLLGCGHCVQGSLQFTLWPSNLIRVTLPQIGGLDNHRKFITHVGSIHAHGYRRKTAGYWMLAALGGRQP